MVNNLKEIYPHIKTIYARAEYPYIDKFYTEHLLKHYNDTYYLEKLLKAGSSVYVQRNYHMIDKSNYCVFYYDKDYEPLKTNTKSGTKLAFEYAIKKNKNIINIFEHSNKM